MEKRIERLAKLARVELTEEEEAKFEKDLESILSAFKDMEKVDTRGVKPTFQPVPVKNVLREDKLEPSLTQEQALANTKNKEKGFFKGPKVA